MPQRSLTLAELAAAIGCGLPLGDYLHVTVGLWAAPRAKKLHADPACGRARNADLAPVQLPLADAAARLCAACVSHLPAMTVAPLVAAHRFTGHLADCDARLADATGSPAGAPWESLCLAARSLSLAETDARHLGGVAATAAAERIADRRRRLRGAGTALGDLPVRVAAADLVDAAGLADAAAEAELGGNPAGLFGWPNRLGPGTNVGWRIGIVAAHRVWCAAIREGATDADAAAAAVDAAVRHWDRHTTMGREPARLAYAGGEFASPTEWAEAEVVAGRRRAAAAAAAAWTGELGRLCASGEAGQVVVGRLVERRDDHVTDLDDRRLLAELYGMRDGATFAAVCPSAVAARLASRYGQYGTTSDGTVAVCGPSAPGDERILGLVTELVAGGMEPADALAAARRAAT